jgi:hypothetical protein
MNEEDEEMRKLVDEGLALLERDCPTDKEIEELERILKDARVKSKRKTSGPVKYFIRIIDMDGIMSPWTRRKLKAELHSVLSQYDAVDMIMATPLTTVRNDGCPLNYSKQTEAPVSDEKYQFSKPLRTMDEDSWVVDDPEIRAIIERDEPLSDEELKRLNAYYNKKKKSES